MTDETNKQSPIQTDALSGLIEAGVSIAKEMRKSRRSANWRMGAFLIFPILIFFFTTMATLKNAGGALQIPRGEGYVSLVKVRGNIEPGGGAAAEFLTPALTRAFADKKSRGVILLINSPGGTPVQANQLYEYVKFCKEEFDKKVVAVGEDMMTSGAYMVAVSADKIYVNRSTMSGSIGVVQQAFGYKALADRIGVESRTITAGENKNRLDPFEDLDPDDVKKMETALQVIHNHFIDVIEEGRGDRLDPKYDLFTGDFWTGDEAVTLGLVDGVSTLQQVMRDEFGVEYALDYSHRKTILQGLNDVLTAGIESAVREVFLDSNQSPPRL